MALPTYPPILTNADWQKQKGVIAKMAGETGIGAQMTKAKEAWDKVPWAKFDAETLCRGMKSVDVYNKAFNDAKKEYPKVEAAKKELWALRDLAKTTAEKWKANKLIPKASREHVEKIATTADQLSVALKSLDNDFTTVKKRFDEATDPATIDKKLKSALAATTKDLESVTAEEMKKDSKANWFGRDFTRFVDAYKFLKDGKVIRDRFVKMDAPTTLKKLVEAMGSSWAVPTDKSYYDASQASGGKLEALVGSSLKNTDELYKVFSLMTQKGLTDVSKTFRDEAKFEPTLRFANKNATPERWDDTDKWSIDVDISAATVKVTHYVTLLEGHDAPTTFKVKLKLERILDRKKGGVKCLPATYTLDMKA